MSFITPYMDFYWLWIRVKLLGYKKFTFSIPLNIKHYYRCCTSVYSYQLCLRMQVTQILPKLKIVNLKTILFQWYFTANQIVLHRQQKRTFNILYFYWLLRHYLLQSDCYPTFSIHFLFFRQEFFYIGIISKMY